MDQTQQYATETLQEMGKRGIDPTPENYSVWYAYVTGANAALRHQVEILASNDQEFDKFRNQSLFEEFILPSMASAAIAREHAPTLEPTALVNEVWLRLHGRGSSPRLPFQNRAHFFAAIATTLGRLLVDRGRARSARKRGGHVGRVSFDDAVFDLTDGGLARLDDGAVESLDRLLAAIEALSAVNPRAADVVRLRFMVGLDVATVAEILGISTRTVYDDWLWSKAWLRRWLTDS